MNQTKSSAMTVSLVEMGRLIDDSIDKVPPTYAEALSKARDRLRGNRFFVAVIGEFKRGKSSLINALLDEPRLLPVDIDVATNVPTAVMYGEQRGATIHFSNGSSTPSTIENISHYVTEEANVANRLGVR